MNTTTGATNPVSGDRARYHGSLVAEHGPVVVEGKCDCYSCYTAECNAQQIGAAFEDRWELVNPLTGRTLRCARRASFTVLDNR